MSDEVGFTELEEAFFRAGETEESVEALSEEDNVPRRPLLARLFSRAQTQS